MSFHRDRMYHKFRLYGFLKNLRLFEPFFILFLREMGMSYLQIGVLYSIREICINLFEIPTGVVADAFGRRKAMLASFSAYLLSFGLFYLLPAFWAYALAMALFALGETFRSGTHKAMILQYLRINDWIERRVEYYGHTRAASQFGSALASLIAAGLVFYTGKYRVIFLASMVPYVLELFLMASYPKDLDGELTPIDGDWRDRMFSRLVAIGHDLVALFRQPMLLRGLFNAASFGAVFKASKDYLQPILQVQALTLPLLLAFEENQRTAILVGVLYCLIFLASSYASASAGRLQQRLRHLSAGVNITHLTGMATLALGGVAAMIGWYPLSIAGFVGAYIVRNVRRPLVVGYLSNLISHRTMATGLSIESQLRTLLTAAVAPPIGYVADRAGVGLAIMVVALVGTALLPLVKTHQAPNNPQ